MPRCVVCGKNSPNKKEFHEFTTKAQLRDLWVTALTKHDSDKASLENILQTLQGKPYLCTTHFSPDSYVETAHYRSLKIDAVPISLVSTQNS